MEKDASKLNPQETFNHTIGDRKVKVTFNLSGVIGKGLTEAALAIKHPDDEDDEKIATDLIHDRMEGKQDSVHYGVLNDADILNWAARGMAYESANRIEIREREAEFKEIMKQIQEFEEEAIDCELQGEVKADESSVIAGLSDLWSFYNNFPYITKKTVLDIIAPGFPYSGDCEDCNELGTCIFDFLAEEEEEE